jgi:hypothetical protein
LLHALIDLIPESLLDRSGSVFYSGKKAFTGTKPIYVLGLNPGGDPLEMSDETIGLHIDQMLQQKPDDWCAYRDESWGNAPKGTWRMQPRVLHFLSGLGLNPGEVPASNIIFVRSRNGRDLAGEFDALAAGCWPFHERVIAGLGIKSIVCFSRSASSWIRGRLNATREVGEFIENNGRRWRSTAYSNKQGITIFTLPHPSVADWACPVTDPTGFVRQTMGM